MQNEEELKQQIQRALPELLRTDPAFRAFVLDLTREVYADRDQTESRFDRVLDELRRDREESARRWDEEKAESARKWAEAERRWAESQRRWEANERKWEESNAHFERVHQEIMAQANKHDRAVGALGARWGLLSERAFRDALAGILEDSFGVEVLRIEDWDNEGTVFGRPDQVELDVIIANGMLLICELKSSIDKGGMYIFERKVRFYERRHDRKADRLIVISPMIDPRAAKVAAALGIETYGDSTEVERI
ncbi:MAG: DUF3782 domain-containing protein [Thiohalocapsa sp. PB-PSB1]|jgi:hypothetical protein|nr:MAG: DUF3782 domain-containing protein [Thiohalocapsa sp. PB-PSB1]